MENLIKIITGFVLFGFIEGLIVVAYYVYDNKINMNIRKFILISFFIGLFNTIMKPVLPPLIFQLMIFAYISLSLSILYDVKLKNSFKSVIKIFLILLVCEMIDFMIAQFVFNIDLFKISIFTKFLWLIPARILEIGIVLSKGGIINGYNLGWQNRKKIV